MSDLDHLPHVLAERMEHYLDEANRLAESWFADRPSRERAGLIVQLAAAMLQREGAEALALALRERSLAASVQAGAGATDRV